MTSRTAEATSVDGSSSMRRCGKVPGRMCALEAPEPDNSVAVRLQGVVQALLRDERGRAAELLQPLAGVTLLTSPIVALPTRERLAWPAGKGTKTRAPPTRLTAAIYLRDRFTCRYCSRWTVPNLVLRLISHAFPEDFPYHPHWQMDTIPRVYWDISTSIDHVNAVSLGGAWDDPGNLVTVCARCQYQKKNLPLEVLGWQIRSPDPNAEWDGLIGEYVPLWRLLGQPDERSHRAWIRALESAHSQPG
jgi:5-methylcytosine-specific restriction endonuclease McrA